MAAASSALRPRWLYVISGALVSLLIALLLASRPVEVVEESQCREASAYLTALGTLLNSASGVQPTSFVPMQALCRRLFQHALNTPLNTTSIRSFICVDKPLEGERQLHNLCNFLNRLSTFMSSTPRRCNASVVVVGAGPVGLLSALQARRRGCRVNVFEKRTSYSRSVFFDLYSGPWFESLETLEAIGLLDLPIEHHRDRFRGAGTQGEVYTVRARVLEKKLALAALISGVEIAFDTPVTAFIANGSAPEVRLGNGSSVPFDIAIDASSSVSVLRKALGIGRVRQRHISLHATNVGHSITLDTDLEQVPSASLLNCGVFTNNNGLTER